MTRPRPHIPLHVRAHVAERQLDAIGITAETGKPLSQRLSSAIRILFGDEKSHLDHDPPLRVRTYNPKIKDVAARYTPNANDPNHLIYRTDHEHRIKTNVRGDGAQFPDRVLITRERRREKKAKPSRRPWARKRKWAARPWPTGRKLRSRKFRQ